MIRSSGCDFGFCFKGTSIGIFVGIIAFLILKDERKGDYQHGFCSVICCTCVMNIVDESACSI